MELEWWVAVSISAIGAATDIRLGEIPNWITLPVIVFAPVVCALAGTHPILWSIGGGLISGIIPYIMFRKGALGAGDVKLFAAIGSVVGVSIGMHVLVLSHVVGSVLMLCKLAWDKKLAAVAVLRPLLPRKWRHMQPEVHKLRMRFGGPIFLGTLWAVLLEMS